MTARFFENEGGRIAYDVQGQGPLVVCVPGMGDVRGEYRFLAAQLAQAGLQAAAMDVRGHGESSVDWDDVSVAGIGSDILALIRTLQAGPAVVVGTSMAAGAAVWAAAEAPEQVRGLVLIGPFVSGETSPAARLLYAALFARPWGPGAWIRYFTTLYPTRKPDDFGAYTAALRANLKEPGRLESLRRMITASKAASDARLGRIRAPALIVMGSKDPDFKDPQAEARRLAERLRSGGAAAEYRMVDEAGHYPHVEMPDVVGEPIAAFALQVFSHRPEQQAQPLAAAAA